MVDRIIPWLRRRWPGIAANVGAVVLLDLLVWSYLAGGFVIDPVKEITIRTGRLAITFLLLSLACTPLVVVTGYARLLQARRPLGMWSLAFAGLHFLTFAVWDYGFNLPLLWVGLAYQPFVVIGSAAFLILLVLGVTSHSGLRKRLGGAWAWVQRLVYLAGALAVWHVVWIKKDLREALGYPALLASLLIIRLPPLRRAVSRLRGELSHHRGERRIG
jgi:methionine sulfoxide reductase heme-binding subunit